MILDKKKEKRKKKLQMLIERSNPQNEQNSNPDDKCIICLEKLANSIFHPCGHGGICFPCSKNMIENNHLISDKPKCHYCRNVFFFVKVFQRILKKF